jgi:hypothetical protein
MSKKQTKTKTQTQYLTRAEVLAKIIDFLKKQVKDNSAVEFGLADPYMDNGECVALLIENTGASGYIVGNYVFNDHDKDIPAVEYPTYVKKLEDAAEKLLSRYESESEGERIKDGKYIFKMVPDLYVDNVYWIETQKDFDARQDDSYDGDDDEENEDED